MFTLKDKFGMLRCCVYLILLVGVNESMQNTDNTQDFMKREYSLIKPYGGGMGLPNWDFIGSTIVTNKFVRLTSDTQSLQGALWNTIVNKLY